MGIIKEISKTSKMFNNFNGAKNCDEDQLVGMPSMNNSFDPLFSRF